MERRNVVKTQRGIDFCGDCARARRESSRVFPDMHDDVRRQRRAGRNRMVKGRKVVRVIVDRSKVRHDADNLVPRLLHSGGSGLLPAICEVSHASADRVPAVKDALHERSVNDHRPGIGAGIAQPECAADTMRTPRASK